MVNLLFNPQGRIGPGPYWQGVIILLIAGAVVSAIAAYGPPAAASIGILSLLFVYPWLCVIGKRLHDAGKSAWWFVAALVAYIIASSGLSAVVLWGQIGPMISEMQSVTPGSPEAAALTREMTQSTFLPQLAISTVVSLVIAFFIGRLSSDPAENRFGPPPARVSESPA